MDMEENAVTSSPIPSEQGDDGGGLSTPAKIGIGVAILVGAVLLILAIIFLLRNPTTTETVRDLFIIVLALESLVIGTLLVVLVYQLIVLIKMLRNDVKPMLESTQETLNTIKGTTTFVSQRVTKPAMAASSYVSGIGRSINTLRKMMPRRHGASPTPSPTEYTASEPRETEKEVSE
jgi:hypothetical protein